MPSIAKRSSVDILGSTRTYSSQVFLVSSGSTWKPPSSVHVDERAVPNSSRPPESDVEGRGSLRDAHRMIHLGHAHHRAVPQSDGRRLHGARGEEELRGGGVRVLLEEMVLDDPEGFEAQLLRDAALLESSCW